MFKATHKLARTGEPCTTIRITFRVTIDDLERGVIDAAHNLARDTGRTSSYDPDWIAEACGRVTRAQAEAATRSVLYQEGATASEYRHEDAGDDVWEAARDRAMDLWPDFYPEDMERPKRSERPNCPTCGGKPYPGMAEGDGQIAWTCQSCGDEWYTDEDDEDE